MNLHQNQDSNQEVKNDVVDGSRRTFAKAGGIVTPVLLMLSNRSAWGANACIGSGFQSYSDAVKNGQTLSHAAPSKDGTYQDWKTPSQWAADHTGWPWQDSNGVNRIIPMRRHPNDPTRFQRWGVNPNNSGSNPAWRPEGPNANNVYGLALNNARNNWGKSFLDQLLGSGYANNVTIYEQLQTSASDLLAYQIATAMNLLTYPVLVQTPDFSEFTLDDFVLFYGSCV